MKNNVRIATEFKKQIKTLVTAAFGFVAALSWNDAIKGLISNILPQSEAWPLLITNAVVVTLVAVVVIYLINRSA